MEGFKGEQQDTEVEVYNIMNAHACAALERLYPGARIDSITAPFTSDILGHAGIESASIFHRLSNDRQTSLLIDVGYKKGIISDEELDRATDPARTKGTGDLVEKVLAHLFGDVPAELVEFYRNQLQKEKPRDLLEE